MDQAVSRMIRARDRRAVLKTRLLTLDAKLDRDHIFAFEGRDDREAYSAWLRRIDPALKFEPFECGSKKKVLNLFDIVVKDKGDLETRVRFFVDRDFDELQGRHGNSNIFVTDRYSVENYLVDRETLEDILRVELHCHEMPDTRFEILNIFEDVYDQFLSATKLINERLYTSRRLGVPIKPITDRLSDISKVEIKKANVGDKHPHEIISFESPLVSELILEIELEFGKLDPRLRYRGKFAISFFRKWLELISQERRENSNKLFPEKSKHKIKNEFSILTLAARSPMPEGLVEFANSNHPPG